MPQLKWIFFVLSAASLQTACSMPLQGSAGDSSLALDSVSTSPNAPVSTEAVPSIPSMYDETTEDHQKRSIAQSDFDLAASEVSKRDTGTIEKRTTPELVQEAYNNQYRQLIQQRRATESLRQKAQNKAERVASAQSRLNQDVAGNRLDDDGVRSRQDRITQYAQERDTAIQLHTESRTYLNTLENYWRNVPQANRDYSVANLPIDRI